VTTVARVPIVPEDKDWTWVLTRPCPECGFDARAFPRADVAVMVRKNASEWEPVLARADVSRRPRPDRWSALEYACHVRDVFRIYDFRLGLMLDEDDPHYPNWDQDETAVAQQYNEQDPGVVRGELLVAGAQLADRFDGVAGAQWDRTGNRSDGAHFTVESFARYMIHDPIHHLHDVAG
jgi:hypothetical protein